jgi:hypothetical protein
VGLCLCGSCAKDVAAEAEWMNYEVGLWNSDHEGQIKAQLST